MTWLLHWESALGAESCELWAASSFCEQRYFCVGSVETERRAGRPASTEKKETKQAKSSTVKVYVSLAVVREEKVQINPFPNEHLCWLGGEYDTVNSDIFSHTRLPSRFRC